MASTYDISLAFQATGWSVLEFFQKPGTGFYVPMYQRAYSWDEGNIQQLIDDLCTGVEELSSNDDAVTFFGTVIVLSADKHKTQVAPKDPKAVPAEVLILVDGQQRLATLGLLALQLHHRISQFSASLPDTQPYADLAEEARIVMGDLSELYSLDLKTGTPPRKPKMIRASDDTWTFDGDDGTNYESELAAVFARYIRDATVPNSSRV